MDKKRYSWSNIDNNVRHDNPPKFPDYVVYSQPLIKNDNEVQGPIIKEHIYKMIKHQRYNIPQIGNLGQIGGIQFEKITNLLTTDIFTLNTEDLSCSLYKGYIRKNTGPQISFNGKKVLLTRLLYHNYIEDVNPTDKIVSVCYNRGICCRLSHLSKKTKTGGSTSWTLPSSQANGLANGHNTRWNAPRSKRKALANIQDIHNVDVVSDGSSPSGTANGPSSPIDVPQRKIDNDAFQTGAYFNTLGDVIHDTSKGNGMSVRHNSHLTSDGKNKSHLSEEKVLQIRHLIKEGHKLDIIAEKMGVSRPCISNIKNGKTYKNVK